MGKDRKENKSRETGELCCPPSSNKQSFQFFYVLSNTSTRLVVVEQVRALFHQKDTSGPPPSRSCFLGILGSRKEALWVPSGLLGQLRLSLLLCLAIPSAFSVGWILWLGDKLPGAQQIAPSLWSRVVLGAFMNRHTNQSHHITESTVSYTHLTLPTICSV